MGDEDQEKIGTNYERTKPVVPAKNAGNLRARFENMGKQNEEEAKRKAEEERKKREEKDAKDKEEAKRKEEKRKEQENEINRVKDQEEQLKKKEQEELQKKTILLGKKSKTFFTDNETKRN